MEIQQSAWRNPVEGIKYSFPYWIYSTAWICNGTDLSIPSQYGEGAHNDYNLSRNGRDFKEKSTGVSKKSIAKHCRGCEQDGTDSQNITTNSAPSSGWSLRRPFSKASSQSPQIIQPFWESHCLWGEENGISSPKALWIYVSSLWSSVFAVHGEKSADT